MPSDTRFAVEEEARRFFDEKRRAIEIKVAHGVMKPGEEFRERNVLERLEEDANAWRASATGCFSDFERARIGEAMVIREEAAGKIVRQVETAYQVLEKCLQGRSALLYLTNDLAASEPCAALLKAQPSEAFDRYQAQLHDIAGE